MGNGKLNLISPPDNLFNFNPSYLLVKPSHSVKQQFKEVFGHSEEEINVYIYEGEDTDLPWLLAVSRNCDIIIIDIDHCDELTKHFISLLLIHPHSFFITNDDNSPWMLISRRRIYHVENIIDMLQAELEDDDDERNDK